MDKMIKRIQFLRKEIDRTEFSKKIPTWQWENMFMELENLEKELGGIIND